MGSFLENFRPFVTFEFSIPRTTCKPPRLRLRKAWKDAPFHLKDLLSPLLGIEQREYDGKNAGPSSNVCQTLGQALSRNTSIARAIALSAGQTEIPNKPARNLQTAEGRSNASPRKMSRTLVHTTEIGPPVHDLEADKIATCVIESAFEIHKRIGPGRRASTYGERLADSLAGSGLTVEPQESILIQLGGRRFNRSLHPPLVVGGAVLVEPKSLASISGIHRKQVLTYLKLANLRCGLLINFGGRHLMENIVRLENPTTDRSVLGAF
jgi:GxxExxY protein